MEHLHRPTAEDKHPDHSRDAAVTAIAALIVLLAFIVVAVLT